MFSLSPLPGNLYTYMLREHFFKSRPPRVDVYDCQTSTVVYGVHFSCRLGNGWTDVFFKFDLRNRDF